VFLVGWRGICKKDVAMNPILIFKSNCQNSKPSTARRYGMLIGVSLLVIAGFSSSCSTARGFGRDVEKTGDKIQNAAS
jgi:predicted small secreted protein